MTVAEPGQPTRIVRSAEDTVVRVGVEVYLKLLRLLQENGDTEFSAFGFMPDVATREITDLFVPLQYNSPGGTHMDDEGVAKLFSLLSEEGLEHEQYGRVWIHSHPTFSVQPSGTDWSTLKRTFGRCPWVLMIIVSLDGGKFNSSVHLRVNSPMGCATRKLAKLEIDYARGWPKEVESWVEARKQLFQDMPSPSSSTAKTESTMDRVSETRKFPNWDFKGWSLKALRRLAAWVDTENDVAKWCSLEEELRGQLGIEAEQLADATLDWYKRYGIFYVWDGESMCEAETGIEVTQECADWVQANYDEFECAWNEPTAKGDNDDGQDNNIEGTCTGSHGDRETQDETEDRVRTEFFKDREDQGDQEDIYDIQTVEHDDGGRVAAASYEPLHRDSRFGAGIGVGDRCCGGGGCGKCTVPDVGVHDPTEKSCTV